MFKFISFTDNSCSSLMGVKEADLLPIIMLLLLLLELLLLLLVAAELELLLLIALELALDDDEELL